MTSREKKTATLAAILLLLFGAGFMLKGSADDGGDDVIPPKPDEPCPEGQHWEWWPRGRKWRCVADLPDVGPDEPVIPAKPFEPEEPEGPVFPAEVVDTDDPNDWIKPYPTGDSFYQVVPGDQFYGQGAASGAIAWRYLATEAFLAAQADGLDNDAAKAFAKKIADNADNRIDATNLVCCAPSNDACYGTWGYDPDKDPAPAYNGRVIRLGPQNANNLERILAGEPMVRCVKIGSAQTKGNKSGVRVDGSCTSHELLWLPRLDWALLRSSAKPSGRASIKPDPSPRADGESKLLPPAFIFADLGIDFRPGSNTAGVTVWGCPQFGTLELE